MFKQLRLLPSFIVALLFWCFSVQSQPTSPEVSIQLWSVKDDLKADFAGTLNALAKMGFQGVEFAGEFGPYKDNPHGLKSLLDKLGLKASGAHVGFDTLAPDKLAATLLFYKTLGIQFVIVPWDERAWHPTGVMALTKQLSELAPQLQKYGMQLGFHNHDKEFAPFQNATYWDYIASNTPSAVLLQLDMGWVLFASQDPLTYINRYPHRTPTTHLKIRTVEGVIASPILGENHLPWHHYIQAVVNQGGAQWLVLEQEEYPTGLTQLQSVARSKQNLDTILSGLAKP
ncbi:sugar phosphate isomerase/epimerase family protein [Pseudoalteromonas fenneropenaei]|uniref:Sugar phosphate isomerase/epimerase family protein n=1 Tax=Pseudoalteromonas fenneropenaei TaxID=1737459 RepID=A0ABV7CGF6_9GAMM